MRTRRTRFWVELTATVGGVLLAIVTAVVPDWLELVTGVDPDRGSGAVEWVVVAVLGAVAVVAGLLVRREWQRRAVPT